MTSEELLALAKPICDAVGVGSAAGVLSIAMDPREVVVEFMEHGQRKTVTEFVDYHRPEPK